jgi:hypothetical protein
MLADATTTTLAWAATLIACSVVLLGIALHVYASWTIRNIDDNDEH